MSSREQPSRLNFTNTRGRDGHLRPDYGNRFYFCGSRGRWGGSAARPAHNFPLEPDLKEGLDTTKIVETIPTPTRPTAPEDFPIDNVKYIASYNWIDAEKPTIVVPGTTPSFFFSCLLFNRCRFASHMDWACCPVHAAARPRLRFCRSEQHTAFRVPHAAPFRRRGRDTWPPGGGGACQLADGRYRHGPQRPAQALALAQPVARQRSARLQDRCPARGDQDPRAGPLGGPLARAAHWPHIRDRL